MLSPKPSLPDQFNTADPSRASASVTDVPDRFRICNLERVHDAGSVVCRFDVVFGPIVVKRVRVHAGRKGQFFLGCPGRRASWAPSGWEDAATFDETFAADILSAAMAELEAADDVYGGES